MQDFEADFPWKTSKKTVDHLNLNLIIIFTFSIHIMFSLIPSDAYDPQGLMRL